MTHDDQGKDSTQAQAVKLTGLVWQRGIVDYAKPMPGMKYVACSTTPAGSWAWWLDEAPETREVCGSEQAAKAAAQADYTARILAAINADAIAALVGALDNLLEAVTASDEIGERVLTITGPTANLKWLIDAVDDASTALAQLGGGE